MTTRLRVTRRLEVSAARVTAYKLAAMALALLVAGVVMAAAGLPVVDFLRKTIEGMTASREGIEQVLVLATPIVMLALAVYVAGAAKLWNIGVEGQFFVGAIAATGIGYLLPGLGWISLLGMAVASMAAGALWALLPALLRAYRGVNEIITTLLMSFIAVQLTVWFATGVWRDPMATALRASNKVDAALPFVPGSAILTVGVVIPIAFLVGIGWLLGRTRWGYEVRMVGSGPAAARYAGMPIEARMVGAMVLSGAVAGCAGMVQLASTTQRLSDSLSNQYGLSAWMIAALAGSWTPGVLVFGFVIAVVFRAGLTLQASGLTTNLVFAIYGVLLASVAVAGVAVGYRFRVIRTRVASADAIESVADDIMPAADPVEDV